MTMNLQIENVSLGDSGSAIHNNRNLGKDIETYYDLEYDFDALLKEQEIKKLSVFENLPKNGQIVCSRQTLVALKSDYSQGGEIRARRVIQRSKKACLRSQSDGSTNSAGSHFIFTADNADLVELHALDEEIKSRAETLRELEARILSFVPNMACDALNKLQFIVLLLHSEAEFEIAYLASTLEECIEVLRPSLEINLLKAAKQNEISR